MPHQARPSTLLLTLLLALLVASQTAAAQGNCEAMPRGPARTDCFIARARIASQKADLAYDKARVEEDIARLQATTGLSAKRDHCRGKVAGTRACYTCCRTHGVSASRCLRNCRAQ